MEVVLLGARSEDVSDKCQQTGVAYGLAVPEVSRFFGIVIQMYIDDHAPAHFHARHAGQELVIAIDGLATIRGRFSPRAHALVVEWAAMHVDELRADWALAKAGLPLSRIEPLR